MSTVFIKLLNMSITASWMILAVILARLLLKKSSEMDHLSIVGAGGCPAYMSVLF